MKHNWEYKRLGEVCDLYQPKTIASTELIEDGEYDVFGANGIIGKYTEYNHEFPEVLLTCRGATCGTINVSNPKSWINGNAMVVHSKSKNLTFDFIRFAMMSLDYSKIITGAAQPQITRQSLAPISIPAPPIEVQKQIVAELDKINEVIDNCKKLLSNLDSLAQSLFYDTFGDPITNPKGWEVKTLKEVCILKSGDSSANRLPDGNIPYVKVGDMNLTENRRGIITSSNFVDIGNKTNLLFPIGTTIFPKRGGAILTNKKRLTKVQICCDLNIMGAIPKNIHPIYLYFFFLEKDFSGLVDGSTVPQINNTDIYPLKILVPPLPLQEQFAKRIEAIEEQKKAVEQTISTLKTLLDARMDYWFN